MDQTIWNEWLKCVRENPDQTAVSDHNRTLSRAQLGFLAASIADRIPDTARRVGIIMDHSVEMIAAILAALKKGAAYIPAEPSFPKERIHFMLQEAKTDVIITNQRHASITENLDTEQILVDPGFAFSDRYEGAGAKERLQGVHQDPKALAYVLYTSGTTGKPKGVSVTNRNVVHYVHAFAHEFHPDASDRMLQYSVCSFDIFVEEVFGSLLNGAMLAIPDAADKKNIQNLMNYVSSEQVTIISGFPYLLQEMNDLPEIPESLRLLISGGDVLRASYVDRLKDKVTVYNTYGPSETTVCAAYYNCSEGNPLEDGTYPVGKPVLGTQIRILDENGTQVPCGETGEICIYGDGVSNGYLGDRQEENRAFCDLADGERMYQSGDMGYVMPDGNIAFLRRKDTQIMILGKRVEVSEVTNVLLRSPLIRQAYVKPETDSRHLSYMVAYIVKENPRTSLDEIREYLKNYLTAFMIPEYFVELDKLPLNVNGKVDVSRLPVIRKDPEEEK